MTKKLTNSQKDQVKVSQLRLVIEGNFLDTDDLISKLEISVEDLMERFEDRLIEHYEKFLPSGWTDEEMEDYHERNFDNEEEQEGT